MNELINTVNDNQLVLELTKTYFASNNIRCIEYENFFNIFMSSYTIFKEQLDELKNSNISIEEMRDLGYQSTKGTD